jgi:hypothetical protein
LTRAIYDYRLEPGDIDINITLTLTVYRLNGISHYHYRAILRGVANKGWPDIIHLDHAIYDYRLEPGDIDIIIALTHAAIYDYRLEPGDYYYRLDTRHNL